ncbi:hypothetical protein CP532_6891 [Ophiocordyceps camponoti-leonardi (nom. inval.)]|nr:hypothetical protein CP532_6891 [Ophiocordyceps camponoti-leonardi (nom. inval.)]
MKSTSAAVTLSFLAAASAQANGNYGQNEAPEVKLLNPGYNVQPGQDFPVQLQGCDSGCVITVKEGHQGNLQNLATPVSFNVMGKTGTINIPGDAPNGRLALEIKDNKGNVNYSPQFDFGGNGVSGAKPNAGDKSSQAPPASASQPSDASQSDRAAPTDASSSGRESSAPSEATITSPASTATQTSVSDDSSTVSPAPSSSGSSSSDRSSSTSTSSGGRSATRTSSSSTRTATSTRAAGDSGVGHNAVPWFLSGALAVLAYLN